MVAPLAEQGTAQTRWTEAALRTVRPMGRASHTDDIVCDVIPQGTADGAPGGQSLCVAAVGR